VRLDVRRLVIGHGGELWRKTLKCGKVGWLIKATRHRKYKQISFTEDEKRIYITENG
jgi:hypothetical protein